MAQMFSWKGRIGRSTFWLTLLFLFIVRFFLELITVPAAGVDQNGKVVLLLVFVPFMAYIGIVNQIKRWHDKDKSGWWVLINLIPFIGLLYSLAVLGFTKGTDGPNRFGEDPVAIDQIPDEA